MNKNVYDVKYRLHAVTAKLNYTLEVFGDHLAKTEKFKSVDGMDAVWLYLIRKYHWTPAQVKAMHPEDIRFVLSEEMEGWVLPVAAREPADELD